MIGYQNWFCIKIVRAASLIKQTVIVDLFVYILVDLFVHSSGLFRAF